jgi:glycosyltransferase 2 family protein
MDQPQTRNSRQVWLGIIISLICLAAIFYFIRPQEIIEALKTARYGFLLLSTAAIILFMFMRAIRWRYMLNNDAPIMTVFHIQNIGYLISTILPLRLGDVARSVLIGSVPPITISRGISTMVVERVLDMLFIVTLLPFTLAGIEYLPEWMRAGSLVSGVAAIAAILILIVAANQRSRVERIVTRLIDYIPFLNTKVWVSRTDNFLAGLNSLTHLKDGTILLLLSAVTWIPIIVAYYTTMLAVNLEATAVMAAFIVCAAALSVALPSSPGQIGVFHAGVIAALQVWGQPEAASASFAFLYHALNSAILITLGIIGIFSTGSTFRQVVDSTRDFLRRKDKESSELVSK